MKILVQLLISITITWSGIAWMQQPEGLERHFQGFPGAFVLYNAKEDAYTRYNPKRCETRFSPCSTFKIPNSIIALETGVAPDAHFYKAYNPKAWPKQDWMPAWLAKQWLRDHTLRSAYKHSVVWFYREMAKEVGSDAMTAGLKQFQYGNQDISGGLTQFWLDSSLTISPNEQVEFLKKFYNNQFNLSEKTHILVKDIMVLKQTPEYRLSGKTGSDGKGLSWLVGYVETKDNTFFFAYNAQLPEDKAGVKHRLKLVQDILQDLNII